MMEKLSLGMSARKKIGNTLYHAFMLILSFIMIYPFVWSLLSSFKQSSQLYGGNPLDMIPRPFTLENYTRLFEVLPFERFLINSVFLSVAMPLCMIAVASLTAYALTRLEFPGRNILFLAFIATMMIPSHVTLIPNYKIIVDMGLINTYAALFLNSMFTGANAFNIFFFRQFFLSIPKDLENAAIIDGCNVWQRLVYVILPQAKPALLAAMIMAMQDQWNNYLEPLIYINSNTKQTISVGLTFFSGMYNIQWNLVFAAAVIVALPILVVFVFLQKYFIQGVVVSGVKG